MGVFQSLSVIALRQVVGGICGAAGLGSAGEVAVGMLTKHFTDHSQKLTSALQTANERAWKALELALAGESFWDKCKITLASAEDKAFREQVQAFLQASPLRNVSVEKKDRCQNALRELREARSRGLLNNGSVAPVDLASETGSFARFDNPQAVIDAEWKIVARTADELRATCPNLFWVLQLRSSSGKSPSLLAVAVRYYFRRAVETDQELFQGLAFTKLDALQESQEKGFAQLSNAMTKQGDLLEETLGSLSGVVIQIATMTTEIHTTTTQAAKTGEDTNARVKTLEQKIDKFLERTHLQNREVRPSDSMSVRSDVERQFIKQVRDEYRALPEEKRRKLPELLNNLGKLELAAGEFVEAQQNFQTVATMESDPKRQAEAHYNAYQAALQRQEWPAALASIRQAIELDSARFAPFPDRYQPMTILGAGGFGVAFLCHHIFMKSKIVVKTLQTDELDCDVDRVFREAQALGQLDHPSIIRLADCGYADPGGKTRPYLAMDYFEGINLDRYVDAHGPVPAEDMLGVAISIAEALQAAHARGILHRDVKPANILVKREGSGWRVKLIDFGLALSSSVTEGKPSTSGSSAQTILGKTIAGTRDYAAPEQMGKSPGVEVGTYSDVYGFGRSCYYALLGTSEPDEYETGILPASWRTLLSSCTRRKVENRLRDFAAVLAVLDDMRQHSEPVPKFQSGSDAHANDEKHWQEKNPATVECARWYADLLAKFHREVRVKFAKTVVTIYVEGKIRVAVSPRRNGRALVSVEKLNEGAVTEAVARLTNEGVTFTNNHNSLRFDVNPQQLKNRKAIHEWITGQLLSVPPTSGDGNDEEVVDADEAAENSEEKQWPHRVGDTVMHKGVTGYKIQKLNDAGTGAYIKHPVSKIGKWASFGRLTIEQAGDGENQDSHDTERDVVVIAARLAWGTYQKYHTWVCQAERSLGQAKYLAFYAQGEIQPVVPEILERHESVVLERDKYPGILGEAVNKMLDLASKETGDENWEGIQKFGAGDVNQVVLLTAPDDPRTVKLAQPVVNDKKAKSGANTAFTMGQRYVSLAKLKHAKTTTELE